MLPFYLLGITSVYSQNVTVGGKVYTADNQPFPGVTVRVKGTSIGATTDGDGTFKIADVPKGSTLVFSAIGHLSQEVPTPDHNAKKLTVNMQADRRQLSEVVAIGYGNIAKRDVSGAITSINRDALEKRQPVNLIDALQSQAAGVLVMNDAGEPGAEGTIRIRGYSTFSSAGNNPLYVIDGVLSESAGNINPNDIESIEVLKDAASAAIYGSRSANGVIIITTKRGAEGKPRIDVRYMSTFGKLAHKLRQANADEVKLYRKLQDPGSSGAADSLNPGYNADNDYQELVAQRAIRQQVDLSVSGASKALSYYTSLQYLDDKGLIVNSWAKTARARINIDYSPSTKFKYGNRMQFYYQKKNSIDEGTTFNQLFQRPTNFAVYYPDGTLTGYVGGRRNPLANALYDKNETETFGTSLFNFIEISLLKDLKFTTNFNVDLSIPHGVNFNPKIISASNPTRNDGSESFDLNIGWQYQAYLNYRKTLHTDHNFNVMAGFSAERAKNNTFDIKGADYVNENVFTANAAGTLVNSGTSTGASAHSMASFFGRLGYSYKSRYLLNATLRHDGSSRFGKADPWGDFPSVSAAWRFSDERFMSWTRRYLSDAKLRVSYGVTGNERIGNYDAMQRITFGSSYYNGVTGAVPSSSFGNPYLSWESTKQFDVGLDLSLFNDRLLFTADYYVKTTSNLLYERPLPSETGYESVRINLGSIQNKGLEFSFNTTPYRTRNFTWNSIFNISFEKGTIRQLYNGETFISGDKWLVQEGGRLGDFYGFKYKGVYAYDQSNAYTGNWERLTPVFENNIFVGYTFNGQKYEGTVRRMYGNGQLLKGGDVEYENLRKDSVIDDADRTIIGNAQPRFYAGWINNLSYKNFTLSFTFNVSWGAELYNNQAATLNNYNTTHIIPQPYVIYNAWKKQGDVTDVPRVKSNTAWNHRVSTRYIEDGSFIRLSYVKLMYALNGDWLRKIKVKGAGVYLWSSNLITWTNYSWYDPEFSSSNALQMGQDNGRYPRRRELGLGLNVNF